MYYRDWFKDSFFEEPFDDGLRWHIEGKEYTISIVTGTFVMGDKFFCRETSTYEVALLRKDGTVIHDSIEGYLDYNEVLGFIEKYV